MFQNGELPVTKGEEVVVVLFVSIYCFCLIVCIFGCFVCMFLYLFGCFVCLFIVVIVSTALLLLKVRERERMGEKGLKVAGEKGRGR